MFTWMFTWEFILTTFVFFKNFNALNFFPFHLFAIVVFFSMPDKSEINVVTNEWVSWVEENISKRVKYYDYKDFHNIQNVGYDNFGKVYRANWKRSEKYFVLKSLFNLDNAT